MRAFYLFFATGLINSIIQEHESTIVRFYLSFMRAHVLLNLLNELKRDKMRG